MPKIRILEAATDEAAEAAARYEKQQVGLCTGIPILQWSYR